MKLVHKAILAVGLAIPAIAAAADIDGTVPLTCTPSAGFDCTPEKACGKLKPESLRPPAASRWTSTLQTRYQDSISPDEPAAGPKHSDQ